MNKRSPINDLKRETLPAAYCGPNAQAFKNQCYRLVDAKFPFEEAYNHCKSDDGSLAIISTKEEMNFLSLWLQSIQSRTSCLKISV